VCGPQLPGQPVGVQNQEVQQRSAGAVGPDWMAETLRDTTICDSFIFIFNSSRMDAPKAKVQILPVGPGCVCVWCSYLQVQVVCVSGQVPSRQPVP